MRVKVLGTIRNQIAHDCRKGQPGWGMKYALLNRFEGTTTVFYSDSLELIGTLKIAACMIDWNTMMEVDDES